MGRIVGIDLGTTYSAVAAVNDLGKAEIAPNREGERITPSVVLFQGDLTQVGTQARRSVATAPDDVVQYVKRQMGDPSWRFVTSTDKEYTAEEISAIILKRLKEDAELALGEVVSDAVITVPAYFDDARRQATVDAGTMAGFNVRRVLNEPTAAALSYGLDDMEFSGTVLVYDLGGGTFDVTAMRIDAGTTFDVLATDGDRNLGGFDWDNDLMNLLNEQVQEQGGPDLFDDDALMADLRDKAESAKRTLTTVEEARLFISADDQNFNLSVKRVDFEAATQHLLSRTEAIIDEVMDQAGLAWDAIDRILLVGGSTRMPMVPAMVERLSGTSPERSINPDEAVALGAAIQAHVEAAHDSETDVSSGEALPVPITVSDVTSQSLGVVAVNPLTDKPENSIIIPHNTKIPAQRSEHYSTIADNQTEILVQITEGDDEDLDYVAMIHDSPLKIPAYPAGAPIEVIMSYDIDGVIHIEVRDLTAGESLGEIELERPQNLDRAEVEEKTKAIRELEVH